MSDSPWTDERVATLTEMYVGGSSASVIGNLIGLSRNSVIGKAHRLGLVSPHNERRASRPPAEARRPYKPRERKVLTVESNGNGAFRVRESRAVVDQYKLRAIEITPRNVSLIDLEKGDCRYPYGDGALVFCGHPVKEGSSYCTPHHHLCWVKPENRPNVARKHLDAYFVRGAA